MADKSREKGEMGTNTFNREPLIKLRVIGPSAASEAQMFKAIALMTLGTVLALPPAAAVAQTGYGTRPNSHPHSSFERGWNRTTKARIVRARARSGCAIIAAPRSKGRLDARRGLAGRTGQCVSAGSLKGEKFLLDAAIGLRPNITATNSPKRAPKRTIPAAPKRTKTVMKSDWLGDLDSNQD